MYTDDGRRVPCLCMRRQTAPCVICYQPAIASFFLPSFAVACVARVDVMEAQLSACSVRCKAALSQYFVYR